MPDETAAQKAITELDGAMVDGRAIKVNVAKPREEKPRSDRRSFAGSRW
jgi:RNA recognition motif-containing protein